MARLNQPERVESPPPEPDDPVQAAYGVPADPSGLTREPAAAGAWPPAPELDPRPGATKWSRVKALGYLEACPKLPIYIPLSRDEESKPGQYVQEVIWNGWSVPVPKGRTIYAPAPLVEILKQSLERYRTAQSRSNRAIDMMLITPDRPGGLFVEEYSDPVAVELARRGAPLRFND